MTPQASGVLTDRLNFFDFNVFVHHHTCLSALSRALIDRRGCRMLKCLTLRRLGTASVSRRCRLSYRHSRASRIVQWKHESNDTPRPAAVALTMQLVDRVSVVTRST